MRSLFRSTVFALATAILGTSAALAADKENVITFAAETDTPATLKLLAAQGKTGRTTPISDNYRPQVKFTGMKNEVTCAVRIPKDKQNVAPGESAEVALNCSEKFSVLEKHRSFVAYEGGRKVAEGSIK